MNPQQYPFMDELMNNDELKNVFGSVFGSYMPTQPSTPTASSTPVYKQTEAEKQKSETEAYLRRMFGNDFMNKQENKSK